jgi:hypothetical protein
MKETYLYIKQHSITGMLYFGKTTKNPETYLGSGKYWKTHITKYGTQYVETVWYCLYTDKNILTEFATRFSKLNDIVNSNQWANLAIENGTDGGRRKNNHLKVLNSLPMSPSRKEAIRQSQLGVSKKGYPVIIDNVEYASIKAASDILLITEQTIYNWIKSGKAKKAEYKFKKPRYSCIECHKELSITELRRHHH